MQNAKNWLTKKYVIKDLLGILVPNCKCKCDKSYDAGEHLDYANCKCRKRLIDKIVEECNEDINGNEMIYNRTLNDYGKVCNSCTIYIVLFAIALIIIGISSAYFYFYWYLKKIILSLILALILKH